MRKEFPILGEQNILLCPICGFNYNHLNGFREYPETGEPYYANKMYSIKFAGECGHSWELCIEQHKGHSFVFRRHIIY